ALEVVPDLALILPERPRRDVRGPERQASRRRNVLETLQRRVDARNMIPQGVLVEAEVVEVEQALRVSAQTDDGPREQVEVVGVARQKTHRAFQKHVLLFAISLLVCAVVANVLISIYITEPGQGLQGSIQEGIVLSKRVQATFDYLFGITIGAFIVVATTAGITSRKDFFHYMTNEFPNSYVFYVFIMVVTIVTILVSPVQVVQVNPTIISFEPYFLF